MKSEFTTHSYKRKFMNLKLLLNIFCFTKHSTYKCHMVVMIQVWLWSCTASCDFISTLVHSTRTIVHFCTHIQMSCRKSTKSEGHAPVGRNYPTEAQGCAFQFVLSLLLYFYFKDCVSFKGLLLPSCVINKSCYAIFCVDLFMVVI